MAYELISINASATDNLGYSVTYREPGYAPRTIEVSHEIGKILFAAIDRGRAEIQARLKDAIGL